MAKQKRKAVTSKSGLNVTEPATEPVNTRRGPFVYSGKQTIELLTAVIDFDPWGQRHGMKGATWRKIAEHLNASSAFRGQRSLNQKGVSDKMAELITSHEHPERTVFTETEAALYDSLIDRAKKLRDRAVTAQEDKSNQVDARRRRLDCDGLRARQEGVRTYLEAKKARAEDGDMADNEFDQPADHPDDNHGATVAHPTTGNQHVALDARAARGVPPDPTVPNVVTTLSTSLGHFIQAESSKFERTQRILASIDQSLATLATAQTQMAKAQHEQNRLMRIALGLEDATTALPSSQSSSPDETAETEVPQAPGPLMVGYNLGEVEEHNKSVRPLTVDEKEEVLGMSRTEFEGPGASGEEEEVASDQEHPRKRRKSARATRRSARTSGKE